MTSPEKATTSTPNPTNCNPSDEEHQQPPVIPTLAVTSPDNYGRIDPENESNLALLASVSDDGLRRTKLRHRTMPAVVDVDDSLRCRSKSGSELKFESLSSTAVGPSDTHPSNASSPLRLLELPAELLDGILSYLSPYELITLSTTSRALRKYALSDTHWQRIVQENVPGTSVTSSTPCSSYHELYAAHDRLWFLPRYKLWFCDRDLTGKLILVRYDPRRGCIEGYQLLAGRRRTTFQQWVADHQVIIHGFEPQIKLHLDKPVLQFRVGDRQRDSEVGFSTRPEANRFADEIPVVLDARLEAMYHNFLLARPLDPEDAEERLASGFPYGHAWPPPAVPALHHVASKRSGPHMIGLNAQDRPFRRSQVSDQTFRIRQWMEMTGTPPIGGIAGFVQAIAAAQPGVRMGEEIITYATLDPSLYTPTELKPWRGIWVGDYSGHGCEFLLLHQPDDPPATDKELGLERRENETDDDWERRRSLGRIHRGRLEAIKLTGDPNVPRGEYTFVVDDLGPGGYVGTANEAPFSGARVVRSKGHVAMTGFLDG